MSRFLHGLSQTREVIASLPSSHQRKLWLLLLLIVVRAGLELAGLAFAYPVLALFASPEAFWKSGVGRWLTVWAGAPDPSGLLVPLVVIFALMFAASAFVSALALVQQYRFVNLLQTEVCARLLGGYLAKPYEFFLQRNVSVLTKNITVTVAEFSTNLILNAFFFVSAAIILSVLVCALLVFNPLVTLSAGAFLASGYAAVFFFLRRRVARWGGERDRQIAGMFKCAEDALGGCRDVKLSGTERLFESRFRAHASRYADMDVRFRAAGAMPGQVAQGTVMVAVAGLLLLVSAQNIRPESLIPTLGVFYVAFLRLLPLGNQLYSSWATVSYYWPTIGIVHAGLVESGDAGDADANRQANANSLEEGISFNRTLKFEDVCYRYPAASSDAVSALSWEIRFGQVIALTGRSGAGKSTVLDLLMGLIRPHRGAIMIDGVPLTDGALAAWRRQVAYVPQDPFFLDAGIAENIAFRLEESEIDWQRLEEAIAGAALTNVVQQLPQGVRTPIGDRGIRLSGGERQRVAIARALYRRPRLLVVDEATSALDADTERSILCELALLRGKITTIIVTHRREVLPYCDAVFRIEAGRVVCAELPPLSGSAKVGGRDVLTGELRQ